MSWTTTRAIRQLREVATIQRRAARLYRDSDEVLAAERAERIAARCQSRADRLGSDPDAYSRRRWAPLL